MASTVCLTRAWSSGFCLALVVASSKNCERRLMAPARAAGSSRRLTHVDGSFSSAHAGRRKQHAPSAAIATGAPARPIPAMPPERGARHSSTARRSVRAVFMTESPSGDTVLPDDHRLRKELPFPKPPEIPAFEHGKWGLFDDVLGDELAHDGGHHEAMAHEP